MLFSPFYRMSTPSLATETEQLLLFIVLGSILLALVISEIWHEKHPRTKDVYCVACFHRLDKSQFTIGNWFDAKAHDRCASCKKYHTRLVEASPHKDNWFSRLLRRFRK